MSGEDKLPDELNPQKNPLIPTPYIDPAEAERDHVVFGDNRIPVGKAGQAEQIAWRLLGDRDQFVDEKSGIWIGRGEDGELRICGKLAADVPDDVFERLLGLKVPDPE